MIKYSQMLSFAINAVLALAGIFISWKIYKRKRKPESMVSYYGTCCDDILTSKFTKFFGIGVEYLGFVYYSLLFIGYVCLLFLNPNTSVALILGLLLMTTIGFIASLYTIFVQSLYVQKWCALSLWSGLISTIIFVLAVTSFGPYNLAAAEILVSNLNTILLIQLFVIAIGVSSATISGFLTINFLKDFKIDAREDRKLTILDQIVWVSITSLLILGLCFYIIDPAFYSASSAKLAELIIFAILILNNAYLSLYISPKLIGIRIDLKSMHIWKTLLLRQYALALGVISILSWYSILFISFFADLANSDLAHIISYYLAITVVAIVVSQITILLVDKIKITSDNKYRFK